LGRAVATATLVSAKKAVSSSLDWGVTFSNHVRRFRMGPLREVDEQIRAEICRLDVERHACLPMRHTAAAR
jgi:hypothetical protein